MHKKSFEQLYREYASAVEAVSPLKAGEDATLARLWRNHKDKRARNRLVEAHLVMVPGYARQTAGRYFNSAYDWGVIRQLIGAGNEGLMLAADRFDPDRGFQFSTAARWSIRKEIIREARLYLSSVSQPYDVKLTRDVMLDGVRDEGDREIEIVVGRVPKRRLLCLEPGANGDPPQDSNFSQMLSDALAILNYPDEATPEAAHAAHDEEELLCGKLDDLDALLHAKANQILDARQRRIYLTRYLTPERTKLKVLAQEFGIAMPRVYQIGIEALAKVHAAISNSEVSSATRLPTWRNIDEWCDRPNHQKRQSIADWLGACDYQLNRVSTLLNAGFSTGELAEALDIPRSTEEDPKYDPAAHLVQLVEWCREAADQDRQRAERLQSYRKHRELELSVTLTTKGHRKARELEHDRQAANGSALAAGCDPSIAAKKFSAA